MSSLSTRRNLFLKHSNLIDDQTKKEEDTVIETAEEIPSTSIEPKRLLDHSEPDSTWESDTESSTESLNSGDLYLEEETDDAAIQELMDRLKKFMCSFKEDHEEENLRSSGLVVLAFEDEEIPKRQETEEEEQKEFPKTPDKDKEKYNQDQTYESESDQDDSYQIGFLLCMMKASQYERKGQRN